VFNNAFPFVTLTLNLIQGFQGLKRCRNEFGMTVGKRSQWGKIFDLG